MLITHGVASSCTLVKCIIKVNVTNQKIIQSMELVLEGGKGKSR